MTALRVNNILKLGSKPKVAATKPAKTNKFSFGSSAGKKTTGSSKPSLFARKAPANSKSVGSKRSGAAPAAPAQSFEIRIPGQFFQAQEDIVWPISLGFTKSNELFVGRMAMLGFAASLLGEVLTGKGALAQFDLETGLPLFDTEPLVLGLIAFNLFAAFAPGKGKFVPDAQEFEERQDGSLQDASISILNPGKFFGVNGIGFTKANELFVGRVAQLGFAASLIGEVITGKGPLAQFDLETGLPLSETEPLLIFSIIFFALTAVNEGTGKFVDEK